MPWWGWVIVGIVIVAIIVRIEQVGSVLMKQKASNQALQEVGRGVPYLQKSIVMVLEDPRMSLRDSTELLGLTLEVRDHLAQANRLGVDQNGMIYVNLWREFAELATNLVGEVVNNEGAGLSPEVEADFRQQHSMLIVKADRLIAANPSPSFLRMMLTGVPPVREVE